MSFEAIASIAEAEARAKQTAADAEARAKQMIADAETAGKAAVEAACEKADSEVAELRRQADEKAIREANARSSENENLKAALRAKAETKLNKAAKLVVERIVNS